MIMTTIILFVSTVLFLILSIFLGRELLKKFDFLQKYVSHSAHLIVWEHEAGRKPGMYNIVLRGSSPFSVLVGFKLRIPIIGHTGFDTYNFLESDESGVAVVHTYLGKSRCEFQFLTNTDLTVYPIVATSTDEDQNLMPSGNPVRPHWYQRIGFYG